MNFSKAFVALSVAAILGGCASGTSVPDDISEHLEQDVMERSIIDEWERSIPKITYVDRKSSLVIEQPHEIPSKISTLQISTKFNKDAKMFDLIGMLKALDIHLVIPEAELLEKPIVLFEFEGRLGDFLNAIGVAYGVNFNWNPGNIMTAESLGFYSLTIPQDKEIAEVIEADLKELGAESVKATVNTSSISYKASYRVHQRIANYLERLNLNTSLVSMQVAMITVALDKREARGVDWSKLNLGLGLSGMLGQGFDPLKFTGDSNSLDGGYGNIQEPGENNNGDNNNSNNSNTNNGNTNNGNTSNGSFNNNSGFGGNGNSTYLAPRGTNLADGVVGATLGGMGSEIGFAKGDFNLGIAIDYLSTFGKTETTQNVVLKTLSGREVAIKSVDKIPYVDEIAIQSGSENGQVNNNSLGQVNVEEIETGLNIELNPLFSAESQLLTVNVEMSLSSLVRMVELQAGNQVGTITHPQTSEQEFNNVVTMRAGESALLGGLIVDRDSDDRNSPLFAPSAAHSSKDFSRQALFIMLRPTVTVFGNFADDKKIVK